MKPAHQTSIYRALPIASAFLYSIVGAQAQTRWIPASREQVPAIVEARLAENGYRLSLHAPVGNYLIERSLHLLPDSWIQVGIVSPVDGFGSFTDVAALSLDNAWYRVVGAFEETDFKLLSFVSSVTSDGYEGSGYFGGIWTGLSNQNLAVQRSGPTSGILSMQTGEFASFRMEPLNPAGVLSAVLENWRDEYVLPFSNDATSWTIDTGEAELSMHKLEGGDHSLIGIRQSDYVDEFETEFGTYSTIESEVEVLWAIAKSSNASPADLAGGWGFIRLFVDGIESDAIYNGEAWATTFTAGPNPLPFSIGAYSEFDVEHLFPSGEVDALYGNYTENPAQQLTLDVAVDGRAVIKSGTDVAYRGMVSPSAKLLVASGSNPALADLPVGQNFAFLSELDGAATEWLIGVKRAHSPQLGGKTYRVIRQGWWVEDDYFEIEYSGEDERLAFDAAGTAVSRTSDYRFEFVTFDGFIDWDAATETFPMTVSVDGQGRILMQSNATGSVKVRTFGYAQEGSNLLILVDSFETDAGPAGVSLMVAVRE
jgi:hypothetical protein